MYVKDFSRGFLTVVCDLEDYEKLVGGKPDTISKEPIGSFNKNYITKVMYQNPATIVFWSDGTKTVSKCDENDTFDEEKGLILCIMKKVFPNKNIGTLLGMWTSGSAETYGKNTVTLKQARKMEKEFSVYWNNVTRKKGE